MTLSLLWSQQRQTSAPSGPAEYSLRPSIRIPVVRFDLVNKCWSISKARLGWGFMFRLGTCLGLISHLLTFWFVVIAEMKTDRLLKIMSVKCYFDLLVLWHHYPRSFGSFRCKSMQVDALRFSKLRFETPFSWTLMLSVLIFLFLRLLFKSCLLQKNACSEPLVSLEPWKTCDLTQSSNCKKGATNRTLWNCFRNFVSNFPFFVLAGDAHLTSDLDHQSLSSLVSAEAVAPSLVTSDPYSSSPTDEGLLQLEPPLSAADYNFTLDNQENLNDLFDNFPFWFSDYSFPESQFCRL